jgi:hypothetical protein
MQFAIADLRANIGNCCMASVVAPLGEQDLAELAYDLARQK